jgi:hypothetical protein
MNVVVIWVHIFVAIELLCTAHLISSVSESHRPWFLWPVLWEHVLNRTAPRPRASENLHGRKLGIGDLCASLRPRNMSYNFIFSDHFRYVRFVEKIFCPVKGSPCRDLYGPLARRVPSPPPLPTVASGLLGGGGRALWRGGTSRNVTAEHTMCRTQWNSNYTKEYMQIWRMLSIIRILYLLWNKVCDSSKL